MARRQPRLLRDEATFARRALHHACFSLPEFSSDGVQDVCFNLVPLHPILYLGGPMLISDGMPSRALYDDQKGTRRPSTHSYPHTAGDITGSSGPASKL